MPGSEEDRERFTLLHEAHGKRLYAIALKVLGDFARAEDAVQQAWPQVLRNWERVNALDWDTAAKYLAVTAKNAALDLLKKERWNTSLPEAYRRVLELKFAEETVREIARRLGLKESTASTKIQRGRKLLLDANWREWQSLWETAAGPDFSSGYWRWRLRLPADPPEIRRHRVGQEEKRRFTISR